VNRLFILPAKPLARAKERLAALLPPDDRVRLVLAMLADVTRAAVACGETWILCSDEAAAAVATSHGAKAVEDATPSGGLNASLSHALARADAEGYASAAVVAADLACIAPEDLHALPDAAVALAPSADGTGTNVLVLSPPLVIAPAFGATSRAAHTAAALAKGIAASIVERPGLALDVDTPEDLARAASNAPGAATRALISELALGL
jgi:2-phospho-L-lactate/phosphoenolpyruvate guanylyltransferase